MSDHTKPRNKLFLWIIGLLVLILPVGFFIAINAFDIDGLPLYFFQLGLYAIFFALAFWGMHQSGIKLTFNFRSVLQAILLLASSWLVYAAVLHLTQIADVPAELKALGSVSAWKIGANILSTWIFVGFGEELLFRGYFMTLIRDMLAKKNPKAITRLAVLSSSFIFSIWHFPRQVFELSNGENSWGLIGLTLLVLFVMGVAFAWLYIRTDNIVLVGLVHGLADFPLIGKDTQMSFIILIAAILLVELAHLMKKKNANIPDEEDF